MAGSRRPGHHGRVREAVAAGHASLEKVPLTGVLLDTDVIIEILRGRYAVRVRLDDLERQRVPVYCTPISWAEVFAGLRPGEELPTETFFLRRGQLILDAEIGRRAGGYLLHYGRSHGLEIADAMIAASAACSGLQLWTLNRRHFPMKDLSLFID